MLTINQAEALANWVEAKGKDLTPVYVTHGHGDHFFGLAQILDRFPKARAVATPATIEVMREQSDPSTIERYWEPILPGQIPPELRVPGPLEASQADRAFDPTTDAAEIERLKADVVLECSGSEPGIRSSLAAARPEGTVVVVGGGRSGLDPIAILLKELRVLGSFTYADEFAEVITLLADGSLQVADLTPVMRA